MARSIIYAVDGAGVLTAMRPSEPKSEDFMQQLVTAHPELISDQDGDSLLIRREQPSRGAGRPCWSSSSARSTSAFAAR